MNFACLRPLADSFSPLVPSIDLSHTRNFFLEANKATTKVKFPSNSEVTLDAHGNAYYCAKGNLHYVSALEERSRVLAPGDIFDRLLPVGTKASFGEITFEASAMDAYGTEGVIWLAHPYRHHIYRVDIEKREVSVVAGNGKEQRIHPNIHSPLWRIQ